MDQIEELQEWCNEVLPELYNPGMFDSEEIAESVFDEIDEAITHLFGIGGIVTDEDHELLVTIIDDWLEEHHEFMIEAVQCVPESVLTSLCNLHQVPQHTPEWFSEKPNCLTSSEAHHILDGRRNALLHQKCDFQQTQQIQIQSLPLFNSAPVGISQEDGEMVATTWGHRFEPIVRRIFEIESAGLNSVCDTLGRFKHPTIPYLRASLDGLIMKGPLQGRLVEIKAPKSRIPGEFVKPDYYTQMQIQMEVTNLEAVEFIEAQFCQKRREFLTEEDMSAIRESAWVGELQVVGVEDDSSTWQYRYSEPTDDYSLDSKPLLDSGSEVLEHSIWWLTGYFPRTVLRNAEWWTEFKPHMEAFWADVLACRSDPSLLKPKATRACGSSGGSSGKSTIVTIEWLGADE